MENDIKKYLLERVRNILLEASLLGTYKKNFSKKMSKEDFLYVCSIDPTTNGDNIGKYCLWLIREDFKTAKRKGYNDFHSYLVGEYDEEEVEFEREVLEFYEKYKGRIKSNYPQYADITKITFEDLIHFYSRCHNQFEREEKEKKLSTNAKCVYDDNEWKIVIPYTWEASKKYGANTKWCTTDSSDDHWFNRYSKNEPLFINFDKRNGEKYQFSLNEKCFFDAADKAFAYNIKDAAKAIDMPQNVLDFYKTKAREIIKQYQEEKGIDTKKKTKSAYKLAIEYSEELGLPNCYENEEEKIADLGRDFLGVLGVCAIAKREFNSDIEFVYNENEWEVNDDSRTIENFGDSVDDHETFEDLETITIYFHDITITYDDVQSLKQVLTYQRNYSKYLIFIGQDELTIVSLRHTCTVDNADFFTRYVTPEAIGEMEEFIPEALMEEVYCYGFNESNAQHVFGNIYIYNNNIWQYNDGKLKNLLKSLKGYSGLKYVEDIYYANKDNGLIIYQCSNGQYVVLADGLDDNNNLPYDGNAYYNDDSYENDEFVNNWLVIGVCDSSLEIYQATENNNVAFNIGNNCSFFCINGEHFSYDVSIEESFGDEIFLMSNNDVMSIYCGKIDGEVQNVRFNSGDRYAYTSHGNNGDNFFLKIDIYNGNPTNANDTDYNMNSDNYYNTDNDDEYSYHMAEQMKLKFTNLLERISKNYNIDKLID